MRYPKTPVWLLLLLLPLATIAQDEEAMLIQLTGQVKSGDGQPMYGVTVYSLGLHTGDVSNTSGFYSLVVTPGDTVRFTFVGFESTDIPVPANWQDSKATLNITMDVDTLILPGATVNPWPSRDKLAFEFMEHKTHNPENDIQPTVGFKRMDKAPKEPDPTIMNPASFIYEWFSGEKKKWKKKPPKNKADVDSHME